MKLLHPFTPQPGNEFVRCGCFINHRMSGPSSLAALRTYLDVIGNSPIVFRLICDLQVQTPQDCRSQMREKIANGEIDLVLTTCLPCIARDTADLFAFLQFCAACGVRVFSFEDNVDTAESDCLERLCVDLEVSPEELAAIAKA